MCFAEAAAGSSSSLGSLQVDVSGKAALQSPCSPDPQPAAIEVSLPWKRVVETVPLSSAFNHTLSGDDNPQGYSPFYAEAEIARHLASTTPEFPGLPNEEEISHEVVAASTSQPPASDHTDPHEPDVDAQTIHSDPEQFRTNGERNLSMTAVRGSEATILAASCSFVSNSNFSDSPDDTFASEKLNEFFELSAASGFKEPDDADTVNTMPLPWVSSSDPNLSTSWTRNSDPSVPRLSLENESHVIPSVTSLPQVQTAPNLALHLDDEQLSSCASNEAAVSEDSCIPPPWRTSMETRPAVPVISPSASFEMDSLLPQPSSQSQRLSEVASHHSEPYLMHHQLIVTPRASVDHDISANLETLDIEDGRMDFMDRVHQWLMSNNPEEQEPLAEDHSSSSLEVKGGDCCTNNSASK